MQTQVKKLILTAAISGLTLVATGCPQQNAQAIEGECHGINECKGTGACGGATHDCAGKNSCKGKGWIKATAEDCKAKKGDYKEHKGH